MRYRYRDDWKMITELNITEWSPSRTFRQGTVNLIFLALPMHFWLKKIVPYLTVSKKLLPNAASNRLGTTIWRTAAHTAIMMPYMQAAIYFGIGTLQGRSIDSGIKLMNDRFAEGYQFALLFWPFIYLGLYAFVPKRFGTLYMDTFRVVWASLVSFVANKKAGKEVPSWPWLIRRLTLS